ncbi:epoxide hydrolase 1 [Lindgomyces ingoldianus]|uniref:Epoxide hydrolase 1 n=1 Tax=Lindgomyces ingoldianus TaxID=673940 RepID=A0ACB6QJ79_9PLEO|nr:epoxide hydrolase 1 [Lindgomyces ingoldianus]KAF2466570.1 epoxide hydrolase 1 [Lindgomyces ingoldianus]
MSAIKQYKISVPDTAIETLRKKLELAVLPGQTKFSNDWKYGTPLNDIRRIVEHWQQKFNWRQIEAKLNELPQFTTKISVDGHEDSLEIHFIHQKGADANSIPLLFCHGWAGSFLEVTKVLPLLTSRVDGSEQTFHVVAPSMPNCGFSQRTSNPGFGVLQYAEVCHKLMLQLGYEKYVTQGGDWGFLITRALGILYPSHVLASHLNFILTSPPSPLSTPLLVLQYLTGRYTASEKAGLERSQWFRTEGSGYNQIQSTKPHTLGFALADSPVALLAWIYEKLHDWTDHYSWNDEEVLTWISIYLFSRAGADASIRLYYEILNPVDPSAKMESFMKWNNTPLGLSYFPRDVVVLPSSWGRTLGPVVFEKRHDKGGHFAAYEKPEMLADDIRKMISNGEISLANTA